MLQAVVLFTRGDPFAVFLIGIVASLSLDQAAANTLRRLTLSSRQSRRELVKLIDM